MDAYPGRSAVTTEPVFSQQGKLTWPSQFERGEVDETDDPAGLILVRDMKLRPPKGEMLPLRPLRERDLDPWGIHIPLRSGLFKPQENRYEDQLQRFPSGTVKTPLAERDQNQTLIEVVNAETAAPPSGPSGGSGATTFLGLTDTPSSYSGQAGLYAKVNSGETAIEFGNLWSAIATYTPDFYTEKFGDGPDVSYPTTFAQPSSGTKAKVEGWYKYNDDYINVWGRLVVAAGDDMGVGTFVFGLPSGFNPPSTARGIRGMALCSPYQTFGGDGSTGGSPGTIVGLATWGGLDHRLAPTVDDGGISEIDIQSQTTTGIRMMTWMTFGGPHGYWGIADGGAGIPATWEIPDGATFMDGGTWLEWNLMIPLR